ncbi:MAG: hypothetical protein GMKNLPBB_00467 [Myxococcota bacterium]|nr:hypothetical protein [Myxococcota bacterium]
MPLGLPISNDHPIPYDLFAAGHVGLEADRARKMENIYHRGQDKIWDGREILKMLVEKHGGVNVKPEHRDAMIYLVSTLMWGEYAAWRVAAQLSDKLEGVEARLAATSQTHDEARHFYVLHDYLTAMGAQPVKPDKWARRLIEMSIRTDNVSHKLLGMQLMIETIALTIFKNLRDAKVEPVISELLPYFERDEARHVGLGTQLLPETFNRIGAPQYARIGAFQTLLMVCSLQELKELEPRLAKLGINPARVMEVANDRFFENFRELKSAGSKERKYDYIGCVVELLMEAYVPHYTNDLSFRGRVKGIMDAARNGLKPVNKRRLYHDELKYADFVN